MNFKNPLPYLIILFSISLGLIGFTILLNLKSDEIEKETRLLNDSLQINLQTLSKHIELMNGFRRVAVYDGQSSWENRYYQSLSSTEESLLNIKNEQICSKIKKAAEQLEIELKNIVSFDAKIFDYIRNGKNEFAKSVAFSLESEKQRVRLQGC